MQRSSDFMLAASMFVGFVELGNLLVNLERIRWQCQGSLKADSVDFWWSQVSFQGMGNSSEGLRCFNTEGTSSNAFFKSQNLLVKGKRNQNCGLQGFPF